MALYIHDGGVFGLAVVDAPDANTARELLMRQFPDRYSNEDGTPCKWVGKWMPKLQPSGKPFYVDGRAKLFPHYDRQGLPE